MSDADFNRFMRRPNYRSTETNLLELICSFLSRGPSSHAGRSRNYTFEYTIENNTRRYPPSNIFDEILIVIDTSEMFSHRHRAVRPNLPPRLGPRDSLHSLAEHFSRKLLASTLAELRNGRYRDGLLAGIKRFSISCGELISTIDIASIHATHQWVILQHPEHPLQNENFLIPKDRPEMENDWQACCIYEFPVEKIDLQEDDEAENRRRVELRQLVRA